MAKGGTGGSQTTESLPPAHDAPGQPPLPSLDALVGIRTALERVEAKLAQVLERQPEQRLLSKREAARLLGVSRGRTLDRLIQERALRPVIIGKRVKIPVAEIERLLLDGAPSEVPAKVPVRRAVARRVDARPPNMTRELAKARCLKVSDLQI